jgi:ubiquinone/menaquinone biosynthesis C-methylase UbiE
MLRIARSKKFSTLVNGDINKLPFKSGIFDCITAYSLLHHLPKHHTLFKEIYRVLNEHGFFYSDWDPSKKRNTFLREYI